MPDDNMSRDEVELPRTDRSAAERAPNPTEGAESSRWDPWKPWGNNLYVVGATVLTGIASLLVAIAGLRSKSDDSAPKQRAEVASPPTTHVAPAPSEVGANLTDCRQAVGKWTWLVNGGLVTLKADGQAVAFLTPRDRAPFSVGEWVCRSGDPTRILIRWQSFPYLDTLTLSQDGSRMSGGQTGSGVALSGVRAD